MSIQDEFSLILRAVALLISNIIKEDTYRRCKFNILKNDSTGYRVIVEFDNCMGEIIVAKPCFAPYRYVSLEILSSISDEFKRVFVWYDCDFDSIEDILFHIREGLEVASKYK